MFLPSLTTPSRLCHRPVSIPNYKSLRKLRICQWLEFKDMDSWGGCIPRPHTRAFDVENRTVPSHRQTRICHHLGQGCSHELTILSLPYHVRLRIYVYAGLLYRCEIGFHNGNEMNETSTWRCLIHFVSIMKTK